MVKLTVGKFEGRAHRKIPVYGALYSILATFCISEIISNWKIIKTMGVAFE